MRRFDFKRINLWIKNKYGEALFDLKNAELQVKPLRSKHELLTFSYFL